MAELLVDVIKSTTINGKHYYPSSKELDKNKRGDNLHFNENGCKGVNVSEADFMYLITRSKAISACDKDVVYDDKDNILRIMDKKRIKK